MCVRGRIAGEDADGGRAVQPASTLPAARVDTSASTSEGLAIRQIRFRFDGQPINETDTPAQLEMEDEDTIDVFQQQTGGSFS
ncbi:hypothetical protein CRUP_011336 [Coryphaenoides rupestris]|nr:hypothetical protein CRUP_011336 [Coryphaenoides rupestris]